MKIAPLNEAHGFMKRLFTLGKNKKPIDCSGVKFAGELSDTAMQYMDRYGEELSRLSKTYNVPITIVERGNLMFVNSGAVTTFYDLSKVEQMRDVLMFLNENVHINRAVHPIETAGKVYNRFV